MTKVIENTTSSKQLINKNYVYPEGEFIGYIVQASLIESATTLCVIPFNIAPFPVTVIWSFIPMSFIFEIIFDFFYYWAHRYLHVAHISWHKTHHTHIHLKPAITFYQDAYDIIFTISLPFILTSYIIQTVYPLCAMEISMLVTYKIFSEISGHSGRALSPSSGFTQFIWLPKWFNIELYTEDHNLHHIEPQCNFSKRFSLWDRAFGTFRR